MSLSYRLHRGTAPLLISIPHAGIAVPKEIQNRLSDAARLLPDTDWHVDRLYDFAVDMGASVLVADYSRYVIDLNRPPDDENLYPGKATTGLVPVDTFSGDAIYQDDIDPDMAEVLGRIDGYWMPYHTALAQELDRIKGDHGHAVLWDAHSIASQVPRFFYGRLPDFNLGTNMDKSCAPDLAQAVLAQAQAATGFTAVLNGRFKGGYITRNYGIPRDHVHAIQLELSQITYMQESAPWPYLDDKANAVRPHLQRMLETCLTWKPA